MIESMKLIEGIPTRSRDMRIFTRELPPII